jgi:hypothetical protein
MENNFKVGDIVQRRTNGGTNNGFKQLMSGEIIHIDGLWIKVKIRLNDGTTIISEGNHRTYLTLFKFRKTEIKQNGYKL